MRRRQLLCLPLCTPWCTPAQTDTDANLVSATPGTLPLLLTVPHDGGQSLGAVPPRTRGTVLRDAGTADLAERVAGALHGRTGARPFLVVARFSRKFLDANRTEAEAMESDLALPAYLAYHGRIAAYVAELKAMHPQGALMVDVHGQSQAPDTIFRGTRAGLTTQRLLQRFGAAALQGERSLIGLLAARGYQVHPGVGAEHLREDPRYAGGHTVATYGSHHAHGVDAIQLEFGKNTRARPQLAADVADALLEFMRHHAMLPA
jgi:N-formylglutamate amidohydrolase